MARRRITGGSLSFQPQAGSISREMDIITKRAADNITSISRQMKVQKQNERDFVQKTLDNIDNLKEESSLIHRTAFNSEIDNLKENVFNAFAKKNKRGKVKGFNIYNPEIRNFVQSEVSRINKLVSRSQPLVDEAEKAIKAINADNTIIDKAEAVARVTDYMNDVNSLISNKSPLVSFNEIITGAQDDELVVNSALAELTKNDETSSKTFSKKEIINGQNVKREQRLDYNLDVVRVDGASNRTFNEDKIKEYTDAMILAHPMKFNTENNRLQARKLVENFFEPKSSIKEDISPVTTGDGSGTPKIVFNAKTDVNTYKFDELDNNIPTLKGYNFSKSLVYKPVEPLEGEEVLKDYRVLGLRENNKGEKLVYAYTGTESIDSFKELILQSDLEDILSKDDEDLNEEERKTKVSILNKLGGLDELKVLPFNETIHKDLKKSAINLEKEQQEIARAGLDYFLDNSLFTDEERKNDDPLGIL